MKTPILLAAGLLTLACAPSAFADDAADCTLMTQVVADSNQGAPYMVDQFTRAEVATLDCPTKAAGFSWSILVPESGLGAGWQDLVKGNFDKGFCSDAARAVAVKAGWKVAARWTTSDAKEFVTEVACP